jgi:hypothetical protein
VKDIPKVTEFTLKWCHQVIPWSAHVKSSKFNMTIQHLTIFIHKSPDWKYLGTKQDKTQTTPGRITGGKGPLLGIKFCAKDPLCAHQKNPASQA